MKKLLVVLLFALSLLLCFASCDLIPKDDAAQDSSSQEASEQGKPEQEIPEQGTPEQEKPHVCTPSAVVIENKVDATCEKAGFYDEVVYCADCNKVLSRESKMVPALGHKIRPHTCEKIYVR